MRRLSFAAVVAALLALAVPAVAKDTVFQTPSKRIACRIYDEGPAWSSAATSSSSTIARCG